MCMYIFRTFLLTDKLWKRRYSFSASLPWNQLPPCNTTINTSTSTFKQKLNNDLIVHDIRTSTQFVVASLSVVCITLITFIVSIDIDNILLSHYNIFIIKSVLK